MNRSTIIGLLRGIGYIALYLLLFRNFVLFDRAFCLIYVAFLLSLPIDSNRITTLFVAFFTGLAIDIFNDSLGIHAAACVLLVQARHYLISWLTPQGGYDGNTMPTATNMGLQWFSTYALPLILIHHIFLFFTEAGGASLFGLTLVKALLSTLFTLLMIVLLQYLFSQSSRTRA